MSDRILEKVEKYKSHISIGKTKKCKSHVSFLRHLALHEAWYMKLHNEHKRYCSEDC